MKKINSYQLLMAGLVSCGLAASLTSCRFEDEDFFDESAALRIEHSATDVQTLLTSSPNGWVLQYFCGTGVSQFEGFNLFARFENSGKVTIAGNHRFLRNGNANQYTEASSVYEMLREDGLVLAFNTWNDVLTPFVDPVAFYDAPQTLTKDGEGMQGDHNFVVLSYNDNEVIMRGERHQAEVRLVKCDRTWQEYIDDTERMRNTITSDAISSYYVTTQTDTVYFTGLRGGRFRYTENLTNPVKIDSLACCFTPDGFRIEHQDTVGSYKFQEFRLNADSTALVNEDGTVSIEAMWDRYVAEATAIQWIDTASLQGELKTLVEQLDAALTAANRNYSLSRIGIGKTTNSNNVTGLCVEWFTNTRKTSRGMGGISMTRRTPSYGQVTISYSDDAIADNNMRARAASVVEAARAVAAALAGTYTITPDSRFTPSAATLTDGSKTLRLTQ